MTLAVTACQPVGFAASPVRRKGLDAFASRTWCTRAVITAYRRVAPVRADGRGRRAVHALRADSRNTSASRIVLCTAK
ncbi:hypothetical protein RKD19_003816 [Streptomyces canus]